MDDRLPAVLKTSRLPWIPDLEHQCPAPANNDSWAALVGTLEWSIIAHQDNPLDPPVFLLGLRDLANDKDVQHVFRAYPSLHDACVGAEAVHDLLLTQLRQALLAPS